MVKQKFPREEKQHDSSGLPLRWYEILTCCCKWRAECKSCMTILCFYYIPAVFVIALAAGCIVVGIIWRTDCDYEQMIPYWLFASAGTPLLLLFSIKAVKEEYHGITWWRVFAIITYLIFIAWLIIGCIWIYNTWMHACHDCCNEWLKLYAFLLTFVHWVFVVVATVLQIYILTQICCCCTQNAIVPLKAGYV